jgi:hypothetical protein
MKKKKKIILIVSSDQLWWRMDVELEGDIESWVWVKWKYNCANWSCFTRLYFDILSSFLWWSIRIYEIWCQHLGITFMLSISQLHAFDKCRIWNTISLKISPLPRLHSSFFNVIWGSTNVVTSSLQVINFLLKPFNQENYFFYCFFTLFTHLTGFIFIHKNT